MDTVIYFRITYNENKADSNFEMHEAQTKSHFSKKKKYIPVP